MAADLETGSEGSFRAPADLPAGNYRVEISKPNYESVELRLRLPLDGPLTLPLPRSGLITGRIADARNQPLSGATVIPLMADAEGRLRPWAASGTRTDDRGEYRLSKLPQGRYAVAVSRATMGQEPASASYLFPSPRAPEIFEIASGTELHGIDFMLPVKSETTVAGSVRGAGRDQRASVALVPAEQPSLAAAIVSTRPDGTFLLEGITSGTYELLTSAPARGYGTFGAVLDSEPVFSRTGLELHGQISGIEAVPQPGRTVRFSLESDPGCPMTATVMLRPLENWGALLESQVELHTGQETVVSHLAPGPYRIGVREPSDACFGTEERIADFRDVESVGVNLVRGGMVEGRLEPAANGAATVLLTPIDRPGAAVRLTVPDRQGRFRFADVRPGRYRVRSDRAVQDISVGSGAAAEVELRSPEQRQ